MCRVNLSTPTSQPVGTGPFKFAAWNRDRRSVLTRTTIIGEQSRLSKISSSVFISDPEAESTRSRPRYRHHGVRSAVQQVKQFEQIRRNRFSRAIRSARRRCRSRDQRSARDKRVRQALYAAIDRKAWIDGVAGATPWPIGSHASTQQRRAVLCRLDRREHGTTRTKPNNCSPPRATPPDAAPRADQRLPYAVAARTFSRPLQAVGVSLDVTPMDSALAQRSVPECARLRSDPHLDVESATSATTRTRSTTALLEPASRGLGLSKPTRSRTKPSRKEAVQKVPAATCGRRATCGLRPSSSPAQEGLAGLSGARHLAIDYLADLSFS